MSVADTIDADWVGTGDLTAGTVMVATFGFGHCAASCTCGWHGKRRHLKAAAEQDAWMHSIHGRCDIAVPLVRPARAG